MIAYAIYLPYCARFLFDSDTGRSLWTEYSEALSVANAKVPEPLLGGTAYVVVQVQRAD